MLHGGHGEWALGTGHYSRRGTGGTGRQPKRAELAAVRTSKAAEAAQTAMLQSRMWDPGKREEMRINRDQSKRQEL
jgi:hypothetical protein